MTKLVKPATELADQDTRGNLLQRPALLEFESLRAVTLGRQDAPLLQELFEDNREFFVICNGRPPVPDEALQEILSEPPVEMTYTSKWVIAVINESNQIVATCIVLSDLMTKGVWLVSLFIVATSLHGTGTAHLIYRQIEQWMHANGAEWIRLGVVKGNVKAERFWPKMGYIQVRERHEVPSGVQVNTLRVMVKPLNRGLIADYLLKVPRDRPEM